MYARAVLRRRPRHPGPDTEFPATVIGVDRVETRARHLQRFCEIVAQGDHRMLPPTYPQVLAAPLHLALFTAPDFPLNPTGIVHLANRIRLLRPLTAMTPLQLRAGIVAQQHTPRGCELVVRTEAGPPGQSAPWMAEAKLLARYAEPARARRRHRPGPRPRPMRPLQVFSLSRNLGRRYARVSGDYNPIHLGTLPARMFGFQRAIAHGMWSLARVLSALTPLPSPVEIDAEFRRPLLLPSRVEIIADDDRCPHFAMRDAHSGKNYLFGTVTPLTQA